MIRFTIRKTSRVNCLFTQLVFCEYCVNITYDTIRQLFQIIKPSSAKPKSFSEFSLCCNLEYQYTIKKTKILKIKF